MTLIAVAALGLGMLLIISALENVSIVQTYRDILAGKPLYTAPSSTTKTSTTGASGQGQTVTL